MGNNAEHAPFREQPTAGSPVPNTHALHLNLSLHILAFTAIMTQWHLFSRLAFVQPALQPGS
jgi:hypothetical protein